MRFLEARKGKDKPHTRTLREKTTPPTKNTAQALAENCRVWLERLRVQRRRERYRQLRTVDRESADDRLTSATKKTTPALSEYHRVSRWQARTSEDNARVRLKYVNDMYTVSVFSALSKEKIVLLP